MLLLDRYQHIERILSPLNRLNCSSLSFSFASQNANAHRLIKSWALYQSYVFSINKNSISVAFGENHSLHWDLVCVLTCASEEIFEYQCCHQGPSLDFHCLSSPCYSHQNVSEKTHGILEERLYCKLRYNTDG